MNETIKVAHLTLCGFDELDEAGCGIAAQRAVNQLGSVKAAAKALKCEPGKIRKWMAYRKKKLPDVGGPDLWPQGPLVPKHWKLLKKEIALAIAASTQSLTPRRAVARFWGVDDSRLRRVGF